MTENVTLRYMPRSVQRKKLPIPASNESPAKKLKLDSNEFSVDKIDVVKTKAFDLMKKTLLHRCQNTLNNSIKCLNRRLTAKNAELEIEIKRSHSAIREMDLKFQRNSAKKNAELEMLANEKYDLELASQRDHTV